MVSSDPTAAKEKEESPHYRASQDYYVLRCLVTTWEGFPTEFLLDHIGAGPQLVWGVFLFCFVFGIWL